MQLWIDRVGGHWPVFRLNPLKIVRAGPLKIVHCNLVQLQVRRIDSEEEL